MNTKLNKSDYILLASYYIIAVIMQVYDYYNEKNSLLEFFIDIPIGVILSLVIIFLYLYWTIPMFAKKKNYLLFIFWGIIILAFFGGIRYVVGKLTAGYTLNDLPSPLGTFFYSISVGTQMTAFPFAILLTKKFYEGQIQLSKIEKQQKENELKLLRSQIDPHFLFNNLNTLDSLIDSNAEKAKEYINRLSLIYRYLIQTKDAEVMELTSELQFAENYIFLIETRFGNDYHFTINKEAVITDKFIPTGALQTLLENVVKHNKANGQPVLTNIIINNDWLTVKNTKTNNTNNESFGTGLQNLQSRYTLLSDKQVVITNKNDCFTVSIPIIQLSDEN
uniref:sensor histidine kinase n=1 Tax=uncultured Tenacibaculum sp. TaxID=174713 RepID=UPI00263A17C6|nr:histidine kinase [uncultured Tenacibaculum sp.]